MIATGTFAPWTQLSRVSDTVVVLFGLLLWASCVVSVCWLGLRAMSAGRHKWKKHKNGRQSKQRA